MEKPWKPYENGWFGCTPILGNPQMDPNGPVKLSVGHPLPIASNSCYWRALSFDEFGVLNVHPRILIWLSEVLTYSHMVIGASGEMNLTSKMLTSLKSGCKRLGHPSWSSATLPISFWERCWNMLQTKIGKRWDVRCLRRRFRSTCSWSLQWFTCTMKKVC